MPRLTAQEAARFWSRTARDENGCWIWRGAQKSGQVGDEYGCFWYKGTSYLAHRVAYFLAFGVDPGTKLVCHKCDVKLCVNPEHLFLGSESDNQRDIVEKKRHWTRLKPWRSARGARSGRYTKPDRTPRGERHGIAKLTEQHVREIRRRYAIGNVSQRQLALEYGVSKSAIRAVLRGETWGHVSQ